jgi:hypothetical protein
VQISEYKEGDALADEAGAVVRPSQRFSQRPERTKPSSRSIANRSTVQKMKQTFKQVA